MKNATIQVKIKALYEETIHCWLDIKIDIPEMGLLEYPFLNNSFGYLDISNSADTCY